MDVANEGTFAPLYDIFFDGILKQIRSKNLEIISRHHCKRIIDLGCGTGSQCRVLSKNGLTVVGIDNSEKMLKVAKKKDIHKTTFVLGDITKKSFSTEPFDCAIISLVLHPNNQKTIRKIIQEAKRIVKKGGILILVDYDYGQHIKGRIAQRFIQLIESFANQSHRSHYFEFMQRGALPAIISKENLQILESFPFYGDALKIYVVQ
ncbi:MAG: methyltransferase domain-containing protein [Candidatus Thermoplasmatota archaeon]|nr:methyltransferase domain-containing protein [Candidatus Thermoplasmatota archaeon]